MCNKDFLSEAMEIQALLLKRLTVLNLCQMTER